MFQHNGGIGGFAKMKQRLISKVSPDLYPSVKGQTDSELAFYLALSNGLDKDPLGALLKLNQIIEETRQETGTKTPWAAALAVSDGTAVYVMRTTSRTDIGDHKVEPSPSLFYTTGKTSLKTRDGKQFTLPATSRIISSEPMVWPYEASEWEEFPDFSVGVFLPGEEPEIMGVPL